MIYFVAHELYISSGTTVALSQSLPLWNFYTDITFYYCGFLCTYAWQIYVGFTQYEKICKIYKNTVLIIPSMQYNFLSIFLHLYYRRYI